MIMNEAEDGSDGSSGAAEIESEANLEDDTENSEENLEADSEGSEEVILEEGEEVPDTEEELEDAVKEALEEGATEEEVVNMIRKFELKVNGKTVEREIDLSDEEAVKRELQKSAAFTEKAKEAKELKQTYEQALQELINDPIAALSQLGIDVDEISSKHILNKIEEEQKTPEQKESDKIKKELEAYRKKAQELEEKQKKDDQDKLIQQNLEMVEKELEEAWENSNVTIPKNPKNISRVVDALEWAENQVDEINGEPLFPGVTIADVLPLVEQEYFEEIGSFIKDAPEDFLEQYGASRKAKKEVEKKVAKKAPTNVSNLQKANAKSKQISTKKEETKAKISS